MKKMLAVVLLVLSTCFSAFSETPLPLDTKEIKIEIKVKKTAELKDVNWNEIEKTFSKFDDDYKKRIVIVVEEYKTVKVKDYETWSKFTVEAMGSKSAKKVIKNTKKVIKSLVKE